MTDDAVITVRDLRKEYGSTVAVDDVSFDVRRDEVFALVGPNGAGKTTAVEMLECLRTPTGGTATVLDLAVGEDRRAIKERIGVLPQSFHAFERLTVRENVALVRDMYDDGLAVNVVLDRLDLDAYADTSFSDLSGGYQQRTGLAMALVSDPDVLFLDEPTTGLDPAARRATWEQIERLADAGTTVVLTTHYMDEVEQLADRAALLVDGQLIAVDTVAHLVDQYGGEVKLVVAADGTATDDTATGDATATADGTATDGDTTTDDTTTADGTATAAPEAEVQSLLESLATETYRTETDDLVGLFDDRGRAQDAFGRLHDVPGDRSIDLVSAGMEDVFLRLAGGVPDAGGDLA